MSILAVPVFPLASYSQEVSQPENFPEGEPAEQRAGSMEVYPFVPFVELSGVVIATEAKRSIGCGGGFQSGVTLFAYPLIFAELGLEYFEFDMSAAADRKEKREVDIRIYGTFIGGGVGWRTEDKTGIGVKWRLHNKNRARLDIKDLDTE